MLSGLNKNPFPVCSSFEPQIINYWPWGGKMQHTGSSWLAGAMSHVRGTPHPLPSPTPQWPRRRFLTEHSVCALSAMSTLISALDRGWRLGFVSSASLFALSLEREFYYGRKCSRVDQICVWVTFVPGQPRKCLEPGRFSRTELAVCFQASPGGSLAGGKFQKCVLHAPPKVTQDEWSWLVSVACDFWEQHWLAFSIRIYTWKWLTGALADICLLLGSVHH